MKYLMITIFLVFASCKKTDNVQSTIDKKQDKLATEQLKPDLTKNYWHLEGKIGETPVAMELKKGFLLAESGGENESSTSFSGTYYYLSEEQPISFYQKDSVFTNNKLNLIAYTTNNNEEIFSGTFDGLTFKGTWEGAGKKLEFELKETIPQHNLKLKHYGLSKNIHSDKNIASIITEFMATENNSLINDTIRKIVFDNAKGDFNTLLQSNFTKYEKQYLADMKQYQEEFNESSMSNNYSSVRTFFPFLNTNNRIVFQDYYYEYTGGAHGIGGGYYYNYDITQNKFLNAKDIFKSNQSALDEMVNKEVHEKYNIPLKISLQDVHRDDISFISDSVPFTDNFIINKKGITFVYNVYEITPYAMGPYTIFIPYEKMKSHLQPSFKF